MLAVVPTTNPFTSLRIIKQQFLTVVSHAVATAAAAAAATATVDEGAVPVPPHPRPPLAASIFDQPPNSLLQPDDLFAANTHAQVERYYQALQWCAAEGHLAANDTIQAIPVDPIFAQAHSDGGGRFSVLTNTAFGGVVSPALDMIMRSSAFPSLAHAVNEYAATRPVLASVAALSRVTRPAINRLQPHMMVMGSQGMGKSHAMVYEVTIKRVNAANRVIFIPHCGVWLTSKPLVYLIECILVGFPFDPPVIAACNQVLVLSDSESAVDVHSDHPLVQAAINLLTFVAMYCQVKGVRLYMYADQTEALTEQREIGSRIDHSTRFPFSILGSSVIPYWSAFGVVLITAASANNNNTILDEVSHDIVHACV